MPSATPTLFTVNFFFSFYGTTDGLRVSISFNFFLQSSVFNVVILEILTSRSVPASTYIILLSSQRSTYRAPPYFSIKYLLRISFIIHSYDVRTHCSFLKTYVSGQESTLQLNMLCVPFYCGFSRKSSSDKNVAASPMGIVFILTNFKVKQN